MMRADVLTAFQERLRGLGVFGKVCGLGCGPKQQGVLARVWIPGCPKESNRDSKPVARLDLRVAIQIETYLAVDAAGDTIDGPLYDLVDTVFSGLHNWKLPGKGSQPVVMLDHPGLDEYRTDGPAIYLMQASVPVMPASFSLT